MAYSLDGLKHGIENKRKNIKVLETAIEKERRDIAQYRIWMDDIERADKAKKFAEANVHLEIVRDNPH